MIRAGIWLYHEYAAPKLAGLANGEQEKRLQQIENSARSLQVLAEQSSAYIPISNNPAKAPSYLTMDCNSPWHTSALQCVALESMTIPSRLRSSNGERGVLHDLEETFNSTGKRGIAKLEMSIADPDVLSEKASEQIVRAEKVGSTTSGLPSEGDEDQLGEFDMDVFTKDYRLTMARPKRREHIFGRAEASRGEWNLAEDRDRRDRFGKGPTVQRYVTSEIAWHDIIRSVPCRRMSAIASLTCCRQQAP